jgi:hypothetical protein
VTGPTRERLPWRTIIAIAVEAALIVAIVVVVVLATS